MTSSSVVLLLPLRLLVCYKIRFSKFLISFFGQMVSFVRISQTFHECGSKGFPGYAVLLGIRCLASFLMLCLWDSFKTLILIRSFEEFPEKLFYYHFVRKTLKIWRNNLWILVSCALRNTQKAQMNNVVDVYLISALISLFWNDSSSSKQRTT